MIGDGGWIGCFLAQGKISLPVVLFPHLLLSRVDSFFSPGDDADLWPGMKKDPPDGTRAGRCLTAPQEEEGKKSRLV